MPKSGGKDNLRSTKFVPGQSEEGKNRVNSPIQARRMISFPFFRKKADPVAALYGDIVAAARDPGAYRDFGVADDFEGRFERLVLVATLVLRRLKALPAPAEDVAQRLVDRLFADLDDGLRRSGVGDLSVGKKMKGLAKGFYGRAEVYTQALATGEAAMRDALARNLFSGRVEADAVAPGLIDEVTRLEKALEEASLDALLAGRVLSPQYSSVAASGAEPS